MTAYGGVNGGFYELLGVGAYADAAAVREAGNKKVAEWSDGANDAGDPDVGDRCRAMATRGALAMGVLQDPEARKRYDAWLDESGARVARCVELLSEGRWGEAASEMDGVILPPDGDKRWAGADQLTLAAEAYYRSGQDDRLGEALSAADRVSPHDPAVLELRGDSLLRGALRDACDLLSSPEAGGTESLREGLERVAEARGCYEEMRAAAPSGDEAASVAGGKLAACAAYESFVDGYLGASGGAAGLGPLEDAVRHLPSGAPGDLPAREGLAGLPPRLEAAGDFYGLCHDACAALARGGFYELLGVGAYADAAAVREAGNKKVAEWSDGANDAGDPDVGDRCRAMATRGALAMGVLQDPEARKRYDAWLDESGARVARCVELLSEGRWGEAASEMDGVILPPDGDKRWAGADQLTLAAEAYYRSGQDDRLGEALSAADRVSPHDPAVLELRGDSLLRGALRDACDLLSSPEAGGTESLREGLERVAEARGCYEEMRAAAPSGDEAASVAGGKLAACAAYESFVDGYLGASGGAAGLGPLEDAVRHLPSGAPGDLPAREGLAGLPPRLEAAGDFYGLCHDACAALKLSSARQQAQQHISRFRLLFIIESIAFCLILLVVISIVTHVIRNIFSVPLAMFLAPAANGLIVLGVSWCYFRLINWQEAEVCKGACNSKLGSEESCDSTGRVRKNIWDNIRIQSIFTSENVSLFSKIGVFLFCVMALIGTLLIR